MTIWRRLRLNYWPLIKGWQTGLLVVTGLAGYLSAPSLHRTGWQMLGLAGSLCVTISGSTVLNMWFDRDLDAKMARTCRRPLSTGQVSANTALWLAVALAAVGLGWSLTLSPLYAAIGLAGMLVEGVVYTVWLKRRTAWSILWGGLAGGLPILAGRALAVGKVDQIGLLLALAIVCWIPAHNLTLGMLYFDDYQQAGVPTFAAAYGFEATRGTLALSSALAAWAMTTAFMGLGLAAISQGLLLALSAGLLGLALAAWVRPSDKLNAGLFKYASVYMLGCMVLLAARALGA